MRVDTTATPAAWGGRNDRRSWWLPSPRRWVGGGPDVNMPSSFAVTASNCLSPGRQLSIAPRTVRAARGEVSGTRGILDRPQALDNERTQKRFVLGQHGRSLAASAVAARPHRPTTPGLSSTQADIVQWATTTTLNSGLSRRAETELRHYQSEGFLPSRPRANERRNRLLKLMEEKQSRARPSGRASRTRGAAHRSRSGKTVGTRHRMELVGSSRDLPRAFRSTSPRAREPDGVAAKTSKYGAGSAGANAFAARVALEEAESRAASRAAQFGHERYERSDPLSPAPWGDT